MLNNENYGYLVHPLSQFMDDNLKPLTSAYLKVFYAGTSSSAYTYSDWEGTLNTSNIILSMNGSANVIAEKNKAYKVMLCDALHPPSSPIWVKDNLYVIGSEIEIGVISSTQIKDNAFDDETDPVHPENITDIEQLIFFRNVAATANYTMVESEKRLYGILLPPPSMEADQNKVPMYKNGNQIAWETVPNEENIDYKISSATQNLQSELTFDTTPTADSTNPVTSGGIKTALNGKQDAFTIIDEDASIAGSTATVSIEQGDLCIVDLSEETSITAVEIVLTNNSEVTFPLWWFKIESGSAVTLSIKIGATSVGWIGSAIANIALGKTIEVSVVDGVACGGELV